MVTARQGQVPVAVPSLVHLLPSFSLLEQLLDARPSHGLSARLCHFNPSGTLYYGSRKQEPNKHNPEAPPTRAPSLWQEMSPAS